MIGISLNQYQVIASIGSGGMGEVFRARDTRLNREVAIKVLPKDFATDPDRLRRFGQESQTLAALNHPNILTVFDAGVHEGAPFLVSELLEGKTLRQELNPDRRNFWTIRSQKLEIRNSRRTLMRGPWPNRPSPVKSWARRITCRPSRSAANQPTIVPTSFPSAAFFTKCSAARARSGATHPSRA